jgi:hypothetical protein
MYGAVTVSRSLVNRNYFTFSTDGGTTYTELPKLGLIYDAIASGVNNTIPNSVNKNLSPRNLMIFSWAGRENFRLKFDWLKSTINGNASTSVTSALNNMKGLIQESILTEQIHKTAGTYTLSKNYCVGMTIVVNSGTIIIDGANALATGTYSFSAPAGSYLGSKSITITGTAEVIYEYLG